MYNPALLHFQGHSLEGKSSEDPTFQRWPINLQQPLRHFGQWDLRCSCRLTRPHRWFWRHHLSALTGKKWIAWNMFEISSDFWTKGCNHKPEPQDTSRSSSTLAPLCALTLAVFALASAAAFGKTKPSSIQSSWRFLSMIKWVWLKCAVANCKLILVAILILICLAKIFLGYILLIHTVHTHLNSKIPTA